MKIISAISAMCCIHLVNGTELSVEGPEGGVVSFLCSHKFAQNNKKYFCKDPCTNDDILALVKPGTVTMSEKITLWDSKDGVFNVTLSKLSTSDSGTYYCGVDRFGIDTFTRVDLRVMEVKRDIISHSHKTTTTNIDPKQETEVTTGTAFESNFTTSHKHEAVTNSTAETFQTDSSTNTSHGFILYLIVGVVVFTVCVVVPLSLRKCREKLRPQVQKCCRAQQLITSNQNQVHVQNDSMADKLKYGQTAVPLQDQNQPIYENISYRQVTGTTTISRSDHFPSYVNPLPALPED